MPNHSLMKDTSLFHYLYTHMKQCNRGLNPAPIFHLNQFEREVYLPTGKWEDTRDGKVYDGGQTILADAPLDSIPVFKKL